MKKMVDSVLDPSLSRSLCWSDVPAFIPEETATRYN